MSNAVHDGFDALIKALDDEGWNEDILDDVKRLKAKYIRER